MPLEIATLEDDALRKIKTDDLKQFLSGKKILI
jgi:hypothetical protein